MRFRVAAVVVISAAWSLPVQAGPPFVTDDPEPVELHHWEFYLAGTYEHAPDTNTAAVPIVEINYGALTDLQLHLVAAGAYNDEPGLGTHFGLGDLELGAKYRFLHEGDWVPQLGVFPIIELPTGDSSKGLGNGHMQAFFPLWAQKSFGPWTTYGGGGWWYNPQDDNRNFWRFGWEVQRDLSEQLTLGAEIFHETSSARGEDGHTAFNVGAIVNFDEHHHLLFSIGRDIEGPTHLTSYLGFQWTF